MEEPRSSGAATSPRGAQQPALGYISVGPHTDASEVQRIRDDLYNFAHQQGHRVEEIYVECPQHASSALAALLEHLTRQPNGSAVVIVPTMNHLARFRALQAALQKVIHDHATLLVMDSLNSPHQET